MRHCILKVTINLICKTSLPAYVVIPYGLFHRHRLVIIFILQKLENKFPLNNNLLFLSF
jgi:hypothetical protein